MLASSPGQRGMSQCPGKAAFHMIVKKSIILFVSVQCQCHCALLHLLVVRSARSSLLQSSLISKANFFIFMCLDILPVTNIAQDQVHSRVFQDSRISLKKKAEPTKHKPGGHIERIQKDF